MRQCSQRMDQRLAGMALVVEPEFLDQLRHLRAQPRHLAGGCGQRGAGPHPCMNGQCGNRAIFHDRHDEQVQRHAAMHQRYTVGLDDKRHQPVLVGRFFKPFKGPVI